MAENPISSNTNELVVTPESLKELGLRAEDIPAIQALAAQIEENNGYTDLMVDGAPSPHQSDTTLRWLIDRLRS